MPNVHQWEGLSSSFCQENAAFHNAWSKMQEPVVGDGYLQSFSKVQKYLKLNDLDLSKR